LSETRRGPAPRTARLLGRDHHLLGVLAAVAEGPAAITLSRGGAPKQYAHTEPNEDATLFVLGPGGVLVAVADGHHGAAGSAAVLEHLASVCAEGWTALRDAPHSTSHWADEAVAALAGANHALLADAATRGLPPAPTTLAVALARPAEDRLLWTGIGDSHVFTVDDAAATDVLRKALAERGNAFLGYESLDEGALAKRSASGTVPLSALRAVVLASDGLSERGIGVGDPERTVHAATRASGQADAELRPLELARHVGDAALAAHRENAAGDNIATAVVWLSR